MIFEQIEKNAASFGLGTSDDKFMAASCIANLIHYEQEGYKPARDAVFEPAGEILDRQAFGIQWLLQTFGASNH